MRKVYVEVKTRLILDIDEGIEVSDVMADMDYNYDSQTDGADVVETEMREYEIVDVK